jgi:arsenic resistance protein ArsH
VRDRSSYLTDRYSKRKEASPVAATSLANAAMPHETAAPDNDDVE